MWTFPNLKTRILSISKSKPFHEYTAHFWSFRGLKTRFLSINKSNSLLDSTAHISTFRTLKPLFVNISKSTLLQNGTANYLNVSRFENAIPYNQQIDHLAVRHSPYLNLLSLKTEFVNISKATTFQDTYLNVSNLKTRFLRISKSST